MTTRSVGTNRLLNAISDHVERKLNRLPRYCDFGRIGDDWALNIIGFGAPIPKGSYRVLRSLLVPALLAITSSAGTPAHTHDVPRPAQISGLAPGDLVLVAWPVPSIPVVVDIVESSNLL